MKNILVDLRIHGIRLKDFLAVSTVFLSVTLTACGGGNGPGDEGDDTLANSNTSSSIQNKSFSAYGVGNTVNTSTVATSFCEQQNILLCEYFEWSSSLSYQATDVDWNLNGWQYTGIAASGNFCRGGGVNESQCALTWVQQNNTKNSTTEQTASYNFSAYGAGEQHIVVNWNMKWSANWLWSLSSTSLFRVNSIDVNQALKPVVVLNVAADGSLQMELGNTSCNTSSNIIKAAAGNELVNDKLGSWHLFELVYKANPLTDRVNVQLSLNNTIIIDASVSSASCNSTQGVNGIAFTAKDTSDNNVNQQNVMIDNVSVLYN